jgi:GNAT superfamily N-acetyltransferase
MVSTIRAATAGDIAAMVELSERKREQYERFQPVFWRKAADSRERHTTYLAGLLARGQHLALVSEAAGALDGFLIAELRPAPPVYDPGGLTCLVDDFVLADEARWDDVGSALLRRAGEEALARGAVQVVVVCAHLDGPKRAMLASSGYSIASEWHVRPL